MTPTKNIQTIEFIRGHFLNGVVAKEAARRRKVLLTLEADIERLSNIKAEEKELKAEKETLTASTLDIYREVGVDGVILDGMSHTTFNGTNVSISQDRLRDALMKHGIAPETALLIMEDSIQRTSYTTIMSKAVEEGSVPGGLTGSGK